MATLLRLSCNQRCHDPHFNTMHIHLIWVTHRPRMDQSGWGRKEKMGHEVGSSWTQTSKGTNYSHTNTMCAVVLSGLRGKQFSRTVRASLCGRCSVNLTRKCSFSFDRVLFSLESDEIKFTDINYGSVICFSLTCYLQLSLSCISLCMLMHAQ